PHREDRNTTCPIDAVDAVPSRRGPATLIPTHEPLSLHPAARRVAGPPRDLLGGSLPAGSRLPPVRALEAQLGLSKNTAQAAYDELVARGLVEAREREGVFVLAASKTATPAPIVAPPLPIVIPPPLGRPDLPARGVTALSTVFIDPD